MFVNLPGYPHTPTYLTFCHYVKSIYNIRYNDENNQIAADPEDLADNDNGKENEESDKAQVLHKLVYAFHEEWLLELSYLELLKIHVNQAPLLPNLCNTICKP